MATTAPIARPTLGRSVRANLSTAELYEDAIRRGEGLVAAEGPLVVRTGTHTGRSPQRSRLARGWARPGCVRMRFTLSLSR